MKFYETKMSKLTEGKREAEQKTNSKEIVFALLGLISKSKIFTEFGIRKPQKALLYFWTVV